MRLCGCFRWKTLDPVVSGSRRTERRAPWDAINWEVFHSLSNGNCCPPPLWMQVSNPQVEKSNEWSPKEKWWAREGLSTFMLPTSFALSKSCLYQVLFQMSITDQGNQMRPSAEHLFWPTAQEVELIWILKRCYVVYWGRRAPALIFTCVSVSQSLSLSFL